MTEEMYEEIFPGQPMAKYVQRFWKFTNPAAALRRYLIFPDGFFDLIVKVGANKQISIVLYGLWTREVEVEAPANSIVMGVCFKPLAADFILQHDIAGLLNNFKELQDNYWNIHEIPFDDLSYWAAQLTKQMSLSLNRLKTVDERKEKLFELLFRSNGELTVKELSKQPFWSSRQINRYFKIRFGLAMKTYSNILRCAATYPEIRDGELFPNQHFYDQAHFIKEIRKHTGYNPKELHHNKNDRFLQFSTSYKK